MCKRWYLSNFVVEIFRPIEAIVYPFGRRQCPMYINFRIQWKERRPFHLFLVHDQLKRNLGICGRKVHILCLHSVLVIEIFKFENTSPIVEHLFVCWVARTSRGYDRILKQSTTIFRSSLQSQSYDCKIR